MYYFPNNMLVVPRMCTITFRLFNVVLSLLISKSLGYIHLQQFGVILNQSQNIVESHNIIVININLRLTQPLSND